jgi:type II secretory pathway component PulC
MAGNLSYVMESYPTDADIAKFRKDKFIIEKNGSYDELYIINTKGLEIDEVDHIGEVEVGSSKADIRKALKKNTKNKLKNRVLLNAFIEKVA